LRIGALICAQGYQSPAVAEENARILQLSHTLGDADAHINALQSRWVMFGSGNDPRAALDFALQALAATRDGTERHRLLALRMCATSSLFVGNLVEAERFYRAFLQLFDDSRHGEDMRRGHSDHRVMAQMGLAETLLLRGEAAEAEQWRQSCLALAEGSGRLHDRCHTLVYAGVLHPILGRRHDEAQHNLSRLDALLKGADMPNWQGHLMLFDGYLRAVMGDLVNAVDLARAGYEALTSARAFGNWWHLVFAATCLEACDWANADAALREAGRIDDKGDQRFGAERLRLQARLLSARDGNIVAEAELHAQALRLAAAQQARHLDRQVLGSGFVSGGRSLPTST
jgi:tetratricopeptide (TPR) repeat protein